MIASILIIILFSSINSCAQVPNVNTYKELISFQENLKGKTAIVVVWGHFGSWGKYSEVHKFFCQNELDKTNYSKITSSLNFKLFADSANYYLPIKEPMKINVDYKNGDLIKLKIRLYKDCKTVNEEIYFLIEDI